MGPGLGSSRVKRVFVTCTESSSTSNCSAEEGGMIGGMPLSPYLIRHRVGVRRGARLGCRRWDVHRARAKVRVGVLIDSRIRRRASEHTQLARLHRGDANLPAADHLALAQREFESLRRRRRRWRWRWWWWWWWRWWWRWCGEGPAARNRTFPRSRDESKRAPVERSVPS